MINTKFQVCIIISKAANAARTRNPLIISREIRLKIELSRKGVMRMDLQLVLSREELIIILIAYLVSTRKNELALLLTRLFKKSI